MPVHLTRRNMRSAILAAPEPRAGVVQVGNSERISRDTPDCTEGSLKQHMSNLPQKLRAAGGTGVH